MDTHKEHCLHLITRYIKTKKKLNEELIILEFLEKLDCLKFIKNNYY
jgi:hypothetical protein